MVLARRPAQRPAAEHVQVEVKDALPGAGAAVGDDAVSRSGNSGEMCGPCSGQEEVPKEVAIVFRRGGDGHHVPAWNDQQVHGGLGVEVVKGERVAILPDHTGGSPPSGDAAEDALTHDCPVPAVTEKAPD